MRELADLFAQEGPEALSEIRGALARADSQALEKAAHSLKGLVGNFAASRAYQAALRLETLAGEEKLSACQDAYVQLEREITRLKNVLDSTLGGQKA